MERKPVDRAKKGCNRCGSTDVAWHVSERGKWYLIEVFNDPRDGYAVGSYRDFHSNYCGKPEEHTAMQARLDADFREDEQEREKNREDASRKREDERIEHEAQMMKTFAALTSKGRKSLISSLQKKYDILITQSPSMDYFTDEMRWRAECDALASEISFYEDLLADLEGGE
jgi:hypothetical protein